jgi:hypothetical protein
VAFGFRSPEALIALAMLSLGGLCPPLPGRAWTRRHRRAAQDREAGLRDDACRAGRGVAGA